jgi:NAD(P)H-binding
MNLADVERAVSGQDAILVSLGIRENALRVRVFGPACTPLNVRSEGTRHIIAAMHKHGVRKLVVQTSYGVGETRQALGLVDRLIFALLLKPQIADTELQNSAVAASGLEWILVQPVHLTDDADDSWPQLSVAGEIERRQVSRGSVGRFLAQAVASREFLGKTVAVSGAGLRRPQSHDPL